VKIFIIAGPNGAGKTTFARFFLKNYPEVTHYLNADVLAAGIVPLQPELAAVEAGRIFLQQIKNLTRQRVSFAFETTLSSQNYIRHITAWTAIGYAVELVFLQLPSADLAIQRVRQRVRQGGHNIPDAVIRRRFDRGQLNLNEYKRVVTAWSLYDNSASPPTLIASGGF